MTTFINWPNCYVRIKVIIVMNLILFSLCWGQVDEECVDSGGRKKRKSCVRSPGSRRSKYTVKSVDDITKEDLDNIAYRAKDKIWDKENVRNSFGRIFILRNTVVLFSESPT